MLYQLWDWWRLQGNTAGHNDAPKLENKIKNKTHHFDVLVNQGVVWHFHWFSRQPEDFEVKIRVSYGSLDFEGFFVVVVVVFLCNRSTLAYASVAKENKWVTI